MSAFSEDIYQGRAVDVPEDFFRRPMLRAHGKFLIKCIAPSGLLTNVIYTFSEC